jgi:hypothetical protein
VGTKLNLSTTVVVSVRKNGDTHFSDSSCVAMCVCVCACVHARECAHMQFSSGITRVSQTWRESRQECVTKCYVVVGANVKKPNNVRSARYEGWYNVSSD